MPRISLLKACTYAADWVKDFYTQAGIWWGEDPQDKGTHAARAAAIDRLCGPGPHRILDLGCGSGFTPAAYADAGHDAVGVELNPTDVGYAQALLGVPRNGTLSIVEGSFYTVDLDGRFDVVTWWQGFGLGSDADQRRMLRRIADEWLAPGGCTLIDVYNPVWAARNSGKEHHLDALEGVPGSVAMVERCTYDAVYCRWIDEWEPVDAPETALAQTIRCYTPADLLLLLEGTRLALKRIEVAGSEIDVSASRITAGGPLMEDWAYLAQLIPEGTVHR